MDFRGILHQIWTVACHTILQAVRMKIVLVLVAFLIVLLLAMPYVLKGDNTHAGQARMVITYSVYLVSFVLSVMTLFLSVAALWNEIKGRQILILDPKPMSRGVLLLGKWLGVMIINSVLLAAMLVVTYLLVVHFVGRQQPNEPDGQYTAFRAQVFEARRSMSPAFPDDLYEKVEKQIQEMQEKDLMPKEYSERWVRNQLIEMHKRGAWNVEPNGDQKWVIEGVPPFDGWLIVRFRHYAPTQKRQYAIWGRFVINESSQPVVAVPGDSPEGRPFTGMSQHTFAITSDVVKDDKVEIRYINCDGGKENQSAMFPYQGGIEVLYPEAGLFENFVRGGVVILCKLAFLSIVGIFASTFVGFPVGVLLTITVYIVGLLRFLMFTKMLPSLYLFGTSAQPPWATINQLDTAVRNVIAYFFSIFPSFSSYDVVPLLASGTYVENGAMFTALIWLPLVRGGVLAVLAWLIFSRRQLAAFSPNA